MQFQKDILSNYVLLTKDTNVSWRSDSQHNSRVWLSRASLTVGEQTGVEASEGLSQQRGRQRLVHGRLAREAWVALVHGPKGKVVRKAVHLSRAGVLHCDLLPVQEDRLRHSFSLLPSKRSAEKTIVIAISLSIISTEYNKDFRLKYDVPPGQDGALDPVERAEQHRS